MHLLPQGISTFFFLMLLLLPTSAHNMQKRSSLTMGRCTAFGAIAATTVTNTGATVITGDCGTCPGTSLTGFPPGTATLKEADTAIACNAIADCGTAYDDGKAEKPTCTTLASCNLGGQTLAPGVYCCPTSGITMTGNLTLNGASNPNGQWIFQTVSTLTTAVGAEVLLENGAQGCNAYFLIGSSATIGSSSKLQGNYISYTSITVGCGTTIHGTLCALNGAINLCDDTITAITSCTT
jgi:hypothetical protein